jgi:hypothetical protein
MHDGDLWQHAQLSCCDLLVPELGPCKVFWELLPGLLLLLWLDLGPVPVLQNLVDERCRD